MRTFGFALLAMGLLIFAFGINSSEAVTEKVVSGVSGRYTDDTMLYILGGIALALGGGVLISRKPK